MDEQQVSDEVETPPTTSKSQKELSEELARYRPRRRQRYSSVNVLVLSWAQWRPEDIVIAKQVDEVKALFRDTFNYSVHPYEIPSVDSQRFLNVHVAQFIHCYGGDANLIIVYYGGHGAPPGPKESVCVWAADPTNAGPTVDWSVIQPQFFSAGCDVVLLLDCCYAGQAARSSSHNAIELLAATDKDNWTPIGASTWPSFTAGLIEQMTQVFSEESHVSIPGLHRRLLRPEAGLRKQAFYACLSGSGTPGSIHLSRLTKPDNQPSPSDFDQVWPDEFFLDLRLRLLKPLDTDSTRSFLKWVTRDAPAVIQDVEIVEDIIQRAKAANDIATELISPECELSSGLFLSSLTPDGQKHAWELFNAFKSSVFAPRSQRSSSASGTTGAVQVLEELKEKSDALLSFFSNSVAGLDESTLQTLRRNDNATNIKALRDRILMRLTLLSDPARQQEPCITVDFSGDMDHHFRYHYSHPPEASDQQRQRLRVGKWKGTPVLVEYIYYDSEDEQSYTKTARQVARISALHGEEGITTQKPFRCHHSIGFSHELLHGPRFGIVYAFPDPGKAHAAAAGSQHAIPMFRPLSELLEQVKIVPLEQRYRLGHALCEALLHLHSVGWFHKAIKSENVLIYSASTGDDTSHDNPVADNKGDKSMSTAWDLENPYLVGFDISRPEHAETAPTVDFSMANNIYRHPDRWGSPRRFERHHDLYALGILLIEIGLWKALPTIDSKKQSFRWVKDPERLRDFLVDKACSRLSHAAGSRFADAARACLARSKTPGDKFDWRRCESWLFQERVRELVGEPLRLFGGSGT